MNGADLSESDTSDVTGTESVAGNAFGGVADVVPDSLESLDGAVDTDGSGGRVDSLCLKGDICLWR